MSTDTGREVRTTSHTPGPWHTGRVGQRDVLLTVCGGCITYLDVNFESANARLIAAAPELLEALAYASEASPPNDPDQDDSDLIQIEVTAGWVRELREAIAKAGA